MGLCLSLRSLALNDVRNDRIHGSLLIETSTILLDRRFKSFSQGKKTASPAFPVGFFDPKNTPSGSKYRVPAAPVTEPANPQRKLNSRLLASQM
jgi:hypothetical protein